MRRARAWTSSAPQAQPINASARSTALRCAVIRCPALRRLRSRPSNRRSAADPSRTMRRPPNENDFHYLSALLYGAHPLHVKGTRSPSCIRLRSRGGDPGAERKRLTCPLNPPLAGAGYLPPRQRFSHRVPQLFSTIPFSDFPPRAAGLTVEHHHATQHQASQTLLKGVLPDGVVHHVHAAPCGQPLHFHLEVRS